MSEHYQEPGFYNSSDFYHPEKYGGLFPWEMEAHIVDTARVEDLVRGYLPPSLDTPAGQLAPEQEYPEIDWAEKDQTDELLTLARRELDLLGRPGLCVLDPNNLPYSYRGYILRQSLDGQYIVLPLADGIEVVQAEGGHPKQGNLPPAGDYHYVRLSTQEAGLVDASNSDSLIASWESIRQDLGAFTARHGINLQTSPSSYSTAVEAVSELNQPAEIDWTERNQTYELLALARRELERHDRPGFSVFHPNNLARPCRGYMLREFSNGRFIVLPLMDDVQILEGDSTGLNWGELPPQGTYRSMRLSSQEAGLGDAANRNALVVSWASLRRFVQVFTAQHGIDLSASESDSSVQTGASSEPTQASELDQVAETIRSVEPPSSNNPVNVRISYDYDWEAGRWVQRAVH